jgi:CBS domain-containing protein
MSEHIFTPVGDVMIRDIQTIGTMATVSEAIEAMSLAGVSSLVVERRGESDEFGLLVVSDIARKVIAANKSPDRTNVYEIMSKPVLGVPESMDIRNAVRLLVQFNLSRALVVDDRRSPVGIVTLRDMVLRHGKDNRGGHD